MIERLEPRAMLAAVITASNVDSLLLGIDGDVDGFADPGDQIHYTVTVQNTGDASATNLTFQEIINNPNLTLLAGSINVSPLAINDAFSAVANTQLRVGTPDALGGPAAVVAGGNVLSNDMEFVGDTLAANVVISAFDATSTQGGTVNMVTVGANRGSFYYVPLAGDTGEDTFTYTLRDDGIDNIANNGDDLFSVGTVTITIGTNQVWYVDNSAGVGGDGTSSNPFDNLADVSGASGPDGTGDIVYLSTGSGNYGFGMTLLDNQTLWGQNEALVVDGFTLQAAGTDPIIATVGNGVTLASGNTLKGFTIGNTGIAFDIANTTTATVGALTISNVVLNGTGGLFRADAGGTLNVTFDSAGTTSASGHGIQLVNTTGSFTVSAGAISGVNSVDVLVSGGTATVNIASSITSSAGGSVEIAGHGTNNVTISGALNITGGTGPFVHDNTGGTIAFTNASKVVNTGTGVNLTSNTGATVNFTGGGLDIDTTSGTGFNATGGGTVTVQGSGNSITTTTGISLNVVNTTIGGSGLTFQSISTNGATNGIVLNNTGTSGGLTVTGTGSANSGGTLQNTTGTAVALTNTRDVAFNFFRILDAGGEGVSGTGVVNFTFANSTNSGAGDADNEDAFDFGTLSSTNLTGTLSITNSTIEKFMNDGLVIRNVSGSLDVTLTNNTFFDNDTTFGVNAVLIESLSAATTNLDVTGNTFDKIDGPAIQFEAEGTGGTHDVNIIGNTFSHPSANTNFEVGGGVILIVDTVAGNPAELTFDVQGNYFNLISGIPVNVVGLGNATGRIGGDSAANQNGPGGANQGNTIKQAGSSNGAAEDAVRLDFDGNFNPTQSTVASTWTILVKNNFIDQHNGVDVPGDLVPGGSGDQGFVIFNRDHPGTLNATFESNTVTDSFGQGLRSFTADRDGAVTAGPITLLAVVNNSFSNVTSADAISVTSDDLSTVCVDIRGNTKSGGGAPDGNIFLDRRVAGAPFNVEQTSAANVGTVNNGATVTLGPVAPTFSVVCNPPLPTNPLLFAPREVSKAGSQPVKPADILPATVETAGETPARPTAGTAVLRQAELDAMVAAARARWAATGLSEAQLAALDRLKFEVADLPGWYLGEAGGERIRVDRDAGGNGWFVDASAASDALFVVAAAPSPQTVSAAPSPQDGQPRGEAPREQSAAGAPQPQRRYTDPAGAPAGRIDLLTTILHEMGHALGLCDTYAEPDRDSLMYGFLTKGERRLPSRRDAVSASVLGGAPHAHPHFLGTPLNIGDLPAGKTVTITYVVTINAGTTAISTSSQGTVSGSNIASKLTNDPQTGTADDATVTPIHQPPVVSNVAVATNEDTTLTFTAANFTGSFSDPNGDVLTSVRITSLPANGVLKVGGATVASVPTDVAIASIGTLTFVPAANFNGATSFGWNGFDGTLYAVAGATVNITVNPVNDVPSFTKGPDQTVLEDSGLKTVVGWATALSAGPADEVGQALNFIVGNNNPALFSLQPAIAANGTLTFTPAANANGTATVTVQIHDTGGVLNGGVDTSAAQSFLITVTAVNDAPSFVKGADQTVNEDAGAQTVVGWATALSAGPADEVGQALNFIVSNNNNALFSAQPAIAANGTLTYIPAANANGSAVVTVQIHDSGGVLNGGVDTSAPQTFLINVTAVNDAPSFTKGADQTVLEDALAQTVPGWATALSVGPANEAGQVLNFIVGNNNPALFSLQPAIATNGTLTYTPAPNANGIANVTVQIHDNGGTANGGVDTSAPQSFTINVTAVNDVPSITAQVPLALAQGHSRTIVFSDLTVSDADNPYPTGFTLTVQNGANYTRTGNTITPTPGFVGTLSVPVQVNDGTANSNVFNLVVTVNPNAEQVATNATIAPEPGGGFRVSFLGAPTASYTIQYTNSLAPANWPTLGTVAAGSDGRYGMVDIPPANTPMRFYRSTEPYLNDFINGLGAATLRGTAVLTNGAVKLTDEVTGGSGAVTFDSIVAGPALNGFTARFNAAIGPISFGVPADGVSFAVGNLGVGPWGEGGPATPNSLAVGFDTYSNGPANDNIGIHVWVNGMHVAVNATDPYTNGATVPVEIIYDVVNGLTVRFNSVLIFTNLPIVGFSFPATDGRFGISARTGGFSERAVVDDVEITPR